MDFLYGKLPYELREKYSNLMSRCVSDEWAYTSDYKILLNRVSCEKDETAIMCVDVYAFIYYNEEYIYTIHVFSENGSPIKEYVLNLYGEVELNDELFDAIKGSLKCWLDNYYAGNNAWDYEIEILFNKTSPVNDALNMNIFSDNNNDAAVMHEHKLGEYKTYDSLLDSDKMKEVTKAIKEKRKPSKKKVIITVGVLIIYFIVVFSLIRLFDLSHTEEYVTVTVVPITIPTGILEGRKLKNKAKNKSKK